MRYDGLTPQQRRVAELVAKGLTDKVIGAQLCIHPRVVSFHIRRIATRWQLSGNARVQITLRVQTWNVSRDFRISA